MRYKRKNKILRKKKKENPKKIGCIMHSLQDIQNNRNAARKERYYSRITNPCCSVHTCMNFGRNKNQLYTPVILCKNSYNDLGAIFSCCFHYTFSVHRCCCTHMYIPPVHKTVSCYSPERISLYYLKI